MEIAELDWGALSFSANEARSVWQSPMTPHSPANGAPAAPTADAPASLADDGALVSRCFVVVCLVFAWFRCL